MSSSNMAFNSGSCVGASTSNELSEPVEHVDLLELGDEDVTFEGQVYDEHVGAWVSSSAYHHLVVS